MTLPVSDEERHIIREFIRLVNARKSCLTCIHFVESSEGCELAAGSRPPARTIAYGCPKFSEAPPF